MGFCWHGRRQQQQQQQVVMGMQAYDCKPAMSDDDNHLQLTVMASSYYLPPGWPVADNHWI